MVWGFFLSIWRTCEVDLVGNPKPSVSAFGTMGCLKEANSLKRILPSYVEKPEILFFKKQNKTFILPYVVLRKILQTALSAGLHKLKLVC